MELIDAIATPFREMDARSFLLGAVLPGAITSAGLIGLALLRRATSAPVPAWAPPLLIAVAFLPAYFLVYSIGHVSLWPQDGATRVLHAMVVVGFGATLAESLRGRASRFRIPLILLACAGALSLPILPVIDMDSTALFALALGVAFLSVVILSGLCARAHERRPGFALPFLLSAAPFATSFVALYASVASLGQVAGGLTAAVSGVAVALLLFPKTRLTFSAFVVFFTGVGVLLAASRAYGYPRASIPAVALSAATPLPIVALSLVNLRKPPRWALVAVALALTAGLALGAVWLAYDARPQYGY